MYLTPPPGWRAQYDRFARSYERLGRSYQSSVVYTDDLHHFLQDCWHLKDWIRNDSTLSPAVRRSVDRAIHGHRSLRIVADLATAVKHFTSTERRESAEAVDRGTTSGIDQHEPIRIDCTVELGNGSVWSVQRVISEAYRDWHTVLADTELMPRPVESGIA